MRSLHWTGAELNLLDQRLLPGEVRFIPCATPGEVAEAIRHMVVRGAPALATAAAYGVVLAALRSVDAPVSTLVQAVETSITQLSSARPTAVNLQWSMNRMQSALQTSLSDLTASTSAIAAALLAEAARMAEEDISTNRRIGSEGAALIQQRARILTHCNTGTLATVEYGTALGVIRSLHEQNRLECVWVDETRPYLQGARLTAMELSDEGIPYQLITDSTAAYLMQQGQVDAVLVGADRIAKNGDTANKIGTYGLAVLCHHHHIPFYVAAPLSSFDMALQNGGQIPIERRAADEVTHFAGQRIAPVGADAFHVAFDVTPASLISAIVTEAGVVNHPDEEQIARLMSRRDAQYHGVGE